MQRLGAYWGRRMALDRTDGLENDQLGAEGTFYTYCPDERQSIGAMRKIRARFAATGVTRHALPDIFAPLPQAVQPAR